MTINTLDRVEFHMVSPTGQVLHTFTDRAQAKRKHKEFPNTKLFEVKIRYKEMTNGKA